jgi:hypothetical protein
MIDNLCDHMGEVMEYLDAPPVMAGTDRETRQ